MLPYRLTLALAAALILAPLPSRSETIDELKAREAKVRSLVEKVMPSVVAITSADPKKPGSGSGVIVQKDGLILTAAHVTAATGEDIVVVFPDGKRVKGKALGANRITDAGMAKITEEGEWPAVEMGSSDKMRFGDWCVAMGHPGGFNYERRPPVRLGRIWRRDTDGAIFSSNPLIGGDSGGPLFDLEGRVIGINSSIHLTPAGASSSTVDGNRHVAIDTLREDWDRMLKEKAWGRQGFAAPPSPRMGVVFDRDSQEGVRVIEDVDGDSPAGKAGIKNGDVLVGFDGTDILTFHHLQRLINKKKPKDKVKVSLKRGSETVECELELGEPAQSRRRPERRSEGDKPEGDKPKDEGEDPEKEDRPPPPEPNVPDESGPQPFFGAELDETGGKGAKVTAVKENSPAAKAGLVPGDIIVRFNDKDVNLVVDACDVFRPLKPGDKLTFKAKRGETELSADATLDKK
jgi:serine protease Do